MAAPENGCLWLKNPATNINRKLSVKRGYMPLSSHLESSHAFLWLLTWCCLHRMQDLLRTPGKGCRSAARARSHFTISSSSPANFPIASQPPVSSSSPSPWPWPPLSSNQQTPSSLQQLVLHHHHGLIVSRFSSNITPAIRGSSQLKPPMASEE